jgi:hypothetical protein
MKLANYSPMPLDWRNTDCWVHVNQNRNDTSGPNRNHQKTERYRQAFIPDDDIGQARHAAKSRERAQQRLIFGSPPTMQFIKILPAMTSIKRRGLSRLYCRIPSELSSDDCLVPCQTSRTRLYSTLYLGRSISRRQYLESGLAEPRFSVTIRTMARKIK